MLGGGVSPDSSLAKRAGSGEKVPQVLWSCCAAIGFLLPLGGGLESGITTWSLLAPWLEEKQSSLDHLLLLGAGELSLFILH